LSKISTKKPPLLFVLLAVENCYNIVHMAASKSELFVAINAVVDRGASTKAVLKVIGRPLNEIALSGAVDLSGVRRASRHPLGFYTIPLAPDVCIHKWPSTATASRIDNGVPFPDNTVSDIHKHSFDIPSSFLLEGQLWNREGIRVEEEFAFAGGLTHLPRWARGGNHFRIFDAQSEADGNDLIINTNRVARVTDYGEDVPYEEGQAYSVRVGDFHTSTWSTDTLTLMTADNHPSERNLTLGKLVPEYETDEADTHVVRRHVFTPEETIEMVAEISHQLGVDR
jgi:hypothetical protein